MRSKRTTRGLVKARWCIYRYHISIFRRSAWWDWRRNHHKRLEGGILQMAAQSRDVPLQNGYRKPGKLPPWMLRIDARESTPHFCSTSPPSSRFVCGATGKQFTSRCFPWSALPRYKAGTGASVASMPTTTPCTPGPGPCTTFRDRTSL